MSLFESYSYWRCPKCGKENKQTLIWKRFYKFKEFETEEYSKEECEHCGKEYYVSKGEPNIYCFKTNKGRCKNDYIKNMVIDINTKVTIVDEYLAGF